MKTSEVGNHVGVVVGDGAVRPRSAVVHPRAVVGDIDVAAGRGPVVLCDGKDVKKKDKVFSKKKSVCSLRVFLEAVMFC